MSRAFARLDQSSGSGTLRAVRAVIATLFATMLCGGCAEHGFWSRSEGIWSTRNFWIVHPRGPVADASLQSWIVDTGATLVVIGPATLLVMWAMWRYHRRYGKGAYRPQFTHSVPLEAAMWGLPLIIVLGLGFYALHGARLTDPAGPAAMAADMHPDGGKKPIEIDVIATDWQWLFIYPDRHVAAANLLVIPAHTPVRFRLTSSGVATDFFIPQLVGQIDVMPGMRTWQGLIADEPGTYQGFASEYNGPGFPWMRFLTRVVSTDEFNSWIANTASSPQRLDKAALIRFATPTINQDEKVMQFSNVEDGLFDHLMMRVMDGLTFPTPSNMTEKRAHKVNNSRQQTSADQKIPSPDSQ
jgi:cytochrome o ubiquinol oxidase subunit II